MRVKGSSNGELREKRTHPHANERQTQRDRFA